MSGNTFGRLFRLTTYGESHGPALGGVVDGCPAGLALSEELIQKELDRRRPGSGTAGTTRREPDAIRLLSGVFNGVTTGTPIGFSIENTNQRSGDYGPLAAVWRPGHADMTYDAKYGVRDFRGGGRSSGRETAARVAGGAVARALLAAEGIAVRSHTLEIGGLPAPSFTPEEAAAAASRPYCAPCEAAVDVWDELVRAVRGEGDTLGGIVRVEVAGVPAGLGEPVFDRLDAVLAQAFMSVGAVKGVEIGDGFAAARSRGSLNNDAYRPADAGQSRHQPLRRHPRRHLHRADAGRDCGDQAHSLHCEGAAQRERRRRGRDPARGRTARHLRHPARQSRAGGDGRPDRGRRSAAATPDGIGHAAAFSFLPERRRGIAGHAGTRRLPQ